MCIHSHRPQRGFRIRPWRLLADPLLVASIAEDSLGAFLPRRDGSVRMKKLPRTPSADVARVPGGPEALSFDSIRVRDSAA